MKKDIQHFYMFLCIDKEKNRALHFAIDRDQYTSRGRVIESKKLDKKFTSSFRYSILKIGVVKNSPVSVESLMIK